MRSFEAEIQWAGDGQWAALCPVCGATQFINPIPILAGAGVRIPLVRMALGCGRCGANLDVEAPLYQVVGERNSVDPVRNQRH